MARRANPSGSGRGLMPTLLGAATAALLLVASSSVQAGTTPPSRPVAAGGCALPPGQASADAHFITMMIPHHEGAIAMADLALQRSARGQIRALAERIRASQSRENAQMRRWYRQWYGSDVPRWQRPGRGMGWGMPGFTTSLEALRSAPDFDRAFLEQMIAHHRMGVMMASHAQAGSLHPELRDLEAAMVRVQSEEIEQMARWYQQWFSASSR